MSASIAARPRSVNDGGPAALVGAGAFVLWGVLHLVLGVSMVVGGLTDPNFPASELVAESTMFFVCAAVFGAQAIGVGLTLNWRNDRAGYWINLLALGAVDAAFVPILLVPGHIDLVGGLAGPALWLVAAVASTIARRRGNAAP